ncbi:hypothetical protein ILUMI_08886, partial [Ignelater luminosus]
PLLFALVVDEGIKESSKQMAHYKVGYSAMNEVKMSTIEYAGSVVLIEQKGDEQKPEHIKRKSRSDTHKDKHEENQNKRAQRTNTK